MPCFTETSGSAAPLQRPQEAESGGMTLYDIPGYLKVCPKLVARVQRMGPLAVVCSQDRTGVKKRQITKINKKRFCQITGDLFIQNVSALKAGGVEKENPCELVLMTENRC